MKFAGNSNLPQKVKKSCVLQVGEATAPEDRSA